MMKIPRRRTVLTGMLIMLTAAFMVGCASPVTTVPTTATPTMASPIPKTASPVTASTTAAPRDINGAHVRVLGLWSGPELDSFMTVKAAWEKDSGGIVDWEGTQDLPEVLAERMQAGNP